MAVGVGAIRDAAQQRGMSARADLGVAELADLARLDHAAQLRGHRLHAVTDAEHRHALRPHGGRRTWRVAFGDAVRAAREHDALRREPADERIVDVVRMNLAVHVRLAQPARDQLRVLRAEVENQDPGMRRAAMAARSIDAIIRRFLHDLHIVHVRFANAGRRDLDEFAARVRSSSIVGQPQ